MKKEKILRSMDLIDEKYIDEAVPQAAKRRFRHPKLLAFAACFVLMLTGLNLWLFIPFSTEPPDVSRYSDSEYYEIIEKLNVLTYEKPKYKNNFEMVRDSFLMTKDEDTDGGVISSSSVKEPRYVEVTDNQVEGVIEGDLIKRSGEYIYYLDWYDAELLVYTIEGADSKQVAIYPFEGYGDPFPREFYLSSDCKTVTMICSNRSDAYGDWTQIILLDVSDPTNIRERASVDIKGSYTTSRIVDGKLLLLNAYYAYYVGKTINFDDESTFLPQINTGDGFKSIPIADIVVPETLTEPVYTVVCRLDEQTLALEDASAFLSYSDEVYVSTDSIYAIHSYDTVTKNSFSYTTSVAMTEITALSYTGDQFELLGSVAVKGSVKDQYSLDEYEGILRVVTTTDTNRIRKWPSSNIESVRIDASTLDDTSASLYCIDLDSWKIVAEVADFAPKGESVQSVRFDGDSAYVCTAVVVTLTDPVFFFDLSDLDNITYKDTGVIEGFSTSLIDMGDGYLLGIGVGDTRRSLKLEVYEESEKGVISVCSYVFERAYYSQDYKSYLVDRARGLFGLGLFDYTYNPEEGQRYMLFHFDGKELRVLVDEQLAGKPDYKRAVYIDDYLYMFSDADVYISTDEELEMVPDIEENMKVVKVGLSDGE